MKNYHTYLFVTINKDNKHIENFKELKHTFLTTKEIDELDKELSNFTSKLTLGTFYRVYKSLNERDLEKTKKLLIHYLLDHDLTPNKIENIVTSIANKPENALTKKWFFDFDKTEEITEENFEYKVEEFIDELLHVYGAEYAGYHNTPNGVAIVVNKGFDTRDLLGKWKNVELKRDDLICVLWGTK